MLECPLSCTPALIVVSVNGRTWFGTLSLATARIIPAVELPPRAHGGRAALVC